MFWNISGTSLQGIAIVLQYRVSPAGKHAILGKVYEVDG
jgi:hypothetical protein